MLDLDAIKARYEKATKGPWEGNISSIDQACKPWGEVVALEERGSAFMRYQALVMSKDDADFISHAREDVPALVAEVEKWRGLAERASVMFTDYVTSDCGWKDAEQWLAAYEAAKEEP